MPATPTPIVEIGVEVHTMQVENLQTPDGQRLRRIRFMAANRTSVCAMLTDDMWNDLIRMGTGIQIATGPAPSVNGHN